MSKPLNEGQEAAAEAFFQFLFQPGKEFIISGPGGVGKTYLMSALIDDIMPRYFKTCELMGIEPEYHTVHMTATTNKAAEVLAQGTGRPTSTVHSFLNLTVKDDFATGMSKISKTDNWMVHENIILFVDECSMIDTPLRNVILEGTHNCKIVYVGDHCQLAPIMEPISPIYRDNLPFFELTEQMRNADQPALMAVCEQLRHTVETSEFYPIPVVPGVIDLLDDGDMEAMVDAVFMDPDHGSRLLAYTNSRVNDYNDHIRSVRLLPSSYTTGEKLINNNAIRFGKIMLSVEQEVEIHSLGKIGKVSVGPDAELEVVESVLKLRGGVLLPRVPLPVDREHYTSLVKYYQRRKDWGRYFALKNKYPDLRPRDSSTVHKAQGSTHETVFIDLANISTCTHADQVARMLYVAFSRAKHRVFLYGKLADKFGGLLIPEAVWQ